MKKILVIGAGGQIGTELVLKLEEKHGKENVLAADIKADCPQPLTNSNYITLNVLDKERLFEVLQSENIGEVYLLAALLSATAEKQPKFAWELNMQGLFSVLDAAKEKIIDKVFWPSSIAVFGPNTPKRETPQDTIMDPTTVYGISKLAGERWCAYYKEKFNVDVRSIRYPGLISYASLPGGGTTDYAVDIFYHAKAGKKYTCFVDKGTALPMMFMEDAIRATIELMNAPKENLTVSGAYNLAGISFTAEELAGEIQKVVENFEVEYKPDFRQAIANSWPQSINDDCAKSDWNWQLEYDLKKLIQSMLTHVDANLYFN